MSKIFNPNLIGFFFIIALWIVVADVLKLTAGQLLPPFLEVLQSLLDIARDGSLWIDLKATLFRWVVGFITGGVSGVLIGLFLGWHSRLYKYVEFPIEFFRTLPITAIFPLFLIIFGVGDLSKIAMAFMPTFLLMLVNSAAGVQNASKTRITMAKVFGANKSQIFFKIIFFETLPQIMVGVRLAVALSMIVTVVSEMFIGSDHGLGQRIYDSYLVNNVQVLYSVLIVLGCLGFILNKTVVLIERRYVFWSEHA